MKQNHIFYPIAFLLLSVLFSCEKKEKQEAVSVAFDQPTADTNKVSVAQIIKKLPKATEIPYILESTGADYNGSLTNPPANLNKYTNTTSKAAMNLGTYLADLGYSCVYNKTQESLNYFKVLTKLTDNLGVTEAMDVSLIKRFETNINTRDSILYLINYTSQQTNNFLMDNQREPLAALIFSGIYVEGLYLSTGIIETYPDKGLNQEERNQILIELTRLILNQKQTLDQLVELLQKVENNEDASNMLANLQDLDRIYQRNNLDELIQTNKGDLVLSDQSIKEITKKIKDIRASIVG